MVALLEDFKRLLASEQKEEAVNYALSLLESGKVELVELYENILTPALNQMECKLEDRNLCIWKEHVQTANPTYKSVSGVLLTKDGKTLITHAAGNSSTVNIPAGVSKLEDYCLASNKATTITIPEGVTTLGIGCFEGNNLTTISLPSTLTSVNRDSFKTCPSLTAINVAASCTPFSSFDGVFFNKDKTTLLNCPAGKVGSYVVPSTVKILDSNSFYECKKLTSITLPQGLECIFGGALNNCSSLTTLTIPSSIRDIYADVFYGCSKLSSIIVKKASGTVANAPWGAPLGAGIVSWQP